MAGNVVVRNQGLNVLLFVMHVGMWTTWTILIRHATLAHPLAPAPATDPPCPRNTWAFAISLSWLSLLTCRSAKDSTGAYPFDIVTVVLMMELFKIVLTMTFHCYMAYAPPFDPNPVLAAATRL